MEGSDRLYLSVLPHEDGAKAENSNEESDVSETRFESDSFSLQEEV